MHKSVRTVCWKHSSCFPISQNLLIYVAWPKTRIIRNLLCVQMENLWWSLSTAAVSSNTNSFEKLTWDAGNNSPLSILLLQLSDKMISRNYPVFPAGINSSMLFQYLLTNDERSWLSGKPGSSNLLVCQRAANTSGKSYKEVMVIKKKNSEVDLRTHNFPTTPLQAYLNLTRLSFYMKRA